MNINKVVIHDVCDFVGGSQPPKKVFETKNKEGYVRLIQTRDYKTNNFLTYIPVELAKRFCEKQDIIIGRYGPPIFQIFRGLEGAYNVALMKAVPKPNILNDYLYYFLNQKAIFNYVDGLSIRTGGQTGVDLDSLNQYPVLLPDLSYQKCVVNVLKALDDKIEINNRINEELESMAKTLYNYWFVQFDFPDKRGKPYKSNGGKMVWNKELKRNIPDGWIVGGFDDIGDIVGGSTPSTSNSDNFTENGIPWITPKDLSINSNKKFISKGEIDVTPLGMRNASLKLLPKGTILLSSRAPIGYIAISRDEVTTNQGFKSLIPRQDFSTQYVFHTVQLYVNGIIQYASGSTFSEISASTLKMIKIPLPNNGIVKIYTEKVKDIFDKQDILEQENDQLSSLRDWLLPMLMNGQVHVN